MGTNTFVHDLDLAGNVLLHGLEVVVNGLTLWHGAQVARDTTLMADNNGEALFHAICTKRDNLQMFHKRRRKGHVWWCSLPKFGGDCLRRRHSSCALCPMQAARTAPLIPENHGMLVCSAVRPSAWSPLRQARNPETGAEAPPMHEVLRDHRLA